MRGSDAVDLGLEILPGRIVRRLVQLVLILSLVTGTGFAMKAVLWYVNDKAAGVTDTLIPILQEISTTQPSPSNS